VNIVAIGERGYLIIVVRIANGLLELRDKMLQALQTRKREEA
jgi:hypothetical protein